MKALPHPPSPDMRLLTLRDLVWLTGSLAIVIAPHALRAPWWLTLLTLCLYGWRFYCTLNRSPLPARWLTLAVAFVAMLLVWMEYRTLFGRQPGVLLLMFFSGLKLLESRTHRDGTVAAFLGYCLIITNFLYTQSIPTAGTMCIGLFALTATLVGFSAPSRPVRANLRTAALLLAHAAPAALALFVLFPRVHGPLWGLPQDAYAGLTGLSDTMTPGNLSQLALSDAIAFRAAFEAEPPPLPLRYWRGPVLWDFDGRTWSTEGVYPVRYEPPPNPRGVYRYSVVLEAHNHPWLFALETAVSLPAASRMSFDGQVLANVPVRSRLRYEMASAIAPGQAREESRGLLARALRLPAGYNRRAVAQMEGLPLMLRPDMAWLRAARYQWEALAHKWNVWVLGYSPERQRDLMLALGMRDADWQKLTALLFTFLGLMTIGLLVWSLRRLARPDPVQKAWQAFCGKLAPRRIARAPH